MKNLLNKFNLLYILFCEGYLLIAKGTVYNEGFVRTVDNFIVLMFYAGLAGNWGRHIDMANQGKMS